MINWVIEEKVFTQEEIQPIYDAIVKPGCMLTLVEGNNFTELKDTIIDLQLCDDKVVFYGSLQYGRFLQRKFPYVYVFLDEKFSQVVNFSYYFDGHCLNDNYKLVPFYKLEDHLQYNVYPYHNDVFIRPNSGLKPFAGNVIQLDNLESFIGFLEDSYVDKTELCITSRVQNIESEYRFLIAEQDGYKVVSGTSYPDKEEVPREATEFANKVVKELNSYYPTIPDLFTLDICQSDGKMYVLEVGSVSCAGWYWMDAEKVVKTINDYIGKI